MTRHTDNEYPSNWHAGGGEASRPLHEDGYYIHPYYRVLPGSNQHIERFLELRVETYGMPPNLHQMELHYCTEDGEEVRREQELAIERVKVPPENQTTEEGQQLAEDEADELALGLMKEYADWTPDE